MDRENGAVCLPGEVVLGRFGEVLVEFGGVV